MDKISTDSSIMAFERFLKNSHVKYTHATLWSLKNHPHFPGLDALYSTIKGVGLDPYAVRVSYDQLSSSDFPKPALVHIEASGGKFLVVDKADDTNVYCYNYKDTIDKIPKQAFIEVWSGAAIVAENNGITRELNYYSNLLNSWWRDYKNFSFVVFVVLIAIYRMVVSFDEIGPMFYWFQLLNAIGVGYSLVSIAYLFNEDTSLINQFCFEKGSQGGCQTMLHNLSQKVFGILSWSEVSFLFYSTLYFYLMADPSLPGLFVVASSFVMSTTFIPYSLYEQWKVKGWCSYCITGMALISVNASFGVYFFMTSTLPNVNFLLPLSLLILSGMLVSIVYAFVKQGASSNTMINTEYPKLKQVLLRPEVFAIMRRNSPKLDTAKLHIPTLGSLKATNTVTIISNPTCAPCAESNRKISALLSQGVNLRVELIFNSGRNVKSDQFSIAEILLAVTHNLEQTQRIYHEYYGLGLTSKLSDWKNEFLSDFGVIQKTDIILQTHTTWCNTNDVNRTPMILFNGILLPTEYSIDDIKYLI